jgi:hypothetical protein
VGGVTADSNNDGGYAASGIDSATGASNNSGDIPASQTMVAAAKTLGAGLGIPDSVQSPDWVASYGGKTVTGCLNSVPTTA